MSHLKDLGFVITNGIGEKGSRYLFFDVTELPLEATFLYHKDSKIIPIDEVADKVLPTEYTGQIEGSLNYCEMLLKDLYCLRKRVNELSTEVQLLQKGRKA